MTTVSTEDLKSLEHDINPPKQSKGKSKSSKLDHFKLKPRLFHKPHLPAFLSRKDKYADPTYAKMTATTAVAASYSDAELQQHMIASGLRNYPDPATNPVARHLAVAQVAEDLMERTYPRDAAYMAAIGSAFPSEEVDRMLITSVGSSYSDSSSSSDDSFYEDEDEDDLDIGESVFEANVATEIERVCDKQDHAVLDAETRDLLSYAGSSPAAQEAALLEALKRDKAREAEHIAHDSEATAEKLERVFVDSLPADLKREMPAAAQDAFHIALVDELNKAALSEIRDGLAADERALADSMDVKNTYMVSVLEDQKPTDDPLAMQRKSRRLKDSYAKLRGYVSQFGGTRRAKVEQLFGRMSRFVRSIPQNARSRPFIRKYLGAMAVAASLGAADLGAYDTAGILTDHADHPYGQQLVRQRIAADLLAMSDVHSARYMADIGACIHESARAAIGAAVLDIGITPGDLASVRLRPTGPAPDVPKSADGDDLQSILSRGLARVRSGVEPEGTEWEVTPPEPLSANATVVPIAPPAEVARVVAREKKETEAVADVERQTNAVINTVETNAENAAVKTAEAAMDTVPDADAARVPKSVMLAYIASLKKVIETEEFNRLQATVKDAAERKANDELRTQVMSLTKLLEEKNAKAAATGTPGAVPAPTAAVPGTFALPSEAAETVQEEREKREDKVEDAMDRAAETKRGPAMSFFREIMGSSAHGTAGFLKEILPSVSQGAADVLPGVTSAGIESLGNVGVTAATTYADRRAARKAAAAEQIEPAAEKSSSSDSAAKRQQERDVRRQERQANRETRDAEKQRRREERKKSREERAIAKKQRKEERDQRRAARQTGREDRAAEAESVAKTARREERKVRRDERAKRREERAKKQEEKKKRQVEAARSKQKKNEDTDGILGSNALSEKAKRRLSRQAQRDARQTRREAKAAGAKSANKSAKGTYSSRAEKRAAMDKAREAKYGKASASKIKKREVRRAARDKARSERKIRKSSKTKVIRTSKSRPKVNAPKVKKLKKLKLKRLRKGASISDVYAIACSVCDTHDPSAVSEIGCKACGTKFDPETSISSDLSSSRLSDTSSFLDDDDDDDLEIGGSFPSSSSISSSSISSSLISSDSSDTSDDFVDDDEDDLDVGAKCAKLGCRTCVRDPDDDRCECKSCGVRSKALCGGKFCKVCRQRTDGCDPCTACDNTGCAKCFATSPAARLEAYRRERGAMGIKGKTPAPASIGCNTCGGQDGSASKNHTCYGDRCAICALQRKYSVSGESKAVGANLGALSVDGPDPLGDDIEPPLFALNAWGMFELVKFTYPILQQNVEGDWQFPPALSAARVLSLLQRSIRGAEHALMVMDRLCLFLQFAPRMTPPLAPGAVELVHRIAETRMPPSAPIVSASFTQDEVDWVLAGIGASFRMLPESQVWTFVYEMIVGLRASDDKAALMFSTILGYSPLMSLVEAKKFRDANVAKDVYASVSSRICSKL